MGSSNSGDRIAAMAVPMASIDIADVRDLGDRVAGFAKA